MKRNESTINENGQRAGQPLWHRFFQAIYCLGFFVICSIPLLALVAGLQSPNLEKRTLSQKPTIITDGQINLQYTHEIEQYFADHFPLRSYMISGWHSLKQFVFQQSGSKRVIVGDDDWLFFADTLSDYLAAETFSETEYKHLERIITLQHYWLQRRGIDFIFTVAPNKNSIYSQKMPGNYEPFSEKNVTEKLSQYLPAANYLDLFTPLKQLAASFDLPVYHQLDSHWNNLGARQVSAAIIERAQSKKTDLSLKNLPGPVYEAQKNWLGDLAVMLYPSGPPKDWQYYYFEQEAYRYTRPMRSLEDMLIQTRYDQGKYNMLMYRDSFANALIPLLSHVFAEALYSRALPFDYGLLENFDADLVVVEIVERNISQLLDIPPRLPADRIEQVPFTPNETEISAAAAEEIMIKADYDQKWLKISAWFFNNSMQEADRVIIRLPGLQPADSSQNPGSEQSAQDNDNAFYEAFPIINPADNASGTISDNQQLTEHGMTIYLTDMQWQDTRQNMDIYIHNSQGWQKISIKITLPVYK